MNNMELEGSMIEVEIAKRKDPRPNTPGRYLGMTKRGFDGEFEGDRRRGGR